MTTIDLMRAAASATACRTVAGALADALDEAEYGTGGGWREAPLAGRKSFDGGGGGGGYVDGGGGYVDGDGGGGYGGGYSYGGGGGGGGGYSYGGGGGGGYGYYQQFIPGDTHVFELDETVLVAATAGYNPYVFVGRVSKLIGPYGAELADASGIPFAGVNAHWAGLAAGDAAMRRVMRVRRYAGVVRVGCNVSYVTPWVGELPTADQN